MPNKTYIPQREPELLEWSNNLAAQLTADPAAYGQTVESLADFTAAQLVGPALAGLMDYMTGTVKHPCE